MALADGNDAAVVIALHETAAQVLGQAPDAAPGEVTDDSAVAVEGLFAVVEEPAGDQRRNTALLESLKVAQARELEELYASPLVLQRAGLLSRIEAIRERISHEKATAYLAAVSSPVGRARQLADASCV